MASMIKSNFSYFEISVAVGEIPKLQGSLETVSDLIY
jgi:hypothetical protein